MYPYHNQIKKRIKNNELIGYEFVDDYPGIGEALVLHFCTYPYIRVIGPSAYEEYVDILAGWNVKQAMKGASA